MTATFGDFEAADAWDAEPTIAPEQVARRLHRLRRAVAQLAGDDLPSFDDLSKRDRDRTLDAGLAIADYAETYGVGNPEAAAPAIHNLLRPTMSPTVPVWFELSRDEKRIGVELITLIFDWLRREGPR